MSLLHASITPFLLALAGRAMATSISATPHDSYSSSVGVLGCKINTNRVAYWPGSVDCNNICVKLSYGDRSVNLLRIDQSGGAYDISYDAWVYLQTGNSATTDPLTGGGVAMEYEEVDASECADLIHTSDSKLPLSASNSMNFVTSCLDDSTSWVAQNYVLYNICDAVCSLGYDEICTLDLDVSNQPSCTHTLGLTTSLTTAPVYNIEYETGTAVEASTGDVVSASVALAGDEDEDEDDDSGTASTASTSTTSSEENTITSTSVAVAVTIAYTSSSSSISSSSFFSSSSSIATLAATTAILAASSSVTVSTSSPDAVATTSTSAAAVKSPGIFVEGASASSSAGVATTSSSALASSSASSTTIISSSTTSSASTSTIGSTTDTASSLITASVTTSSSSTSSATAFSATTLSTSVATQSVSTSVSQTSSSATAIVTTSNASSGATLHLLAAFAASALWLVHAL